MLTGTKVLVSASLVCWLVSRANVAHIFATMSQASPWWLCLAACSPVVGNFITAARWRELLRAQGVHASQAALFQSCVVANFARHFLPSTIGGDAVRAYDSWKIGAGKSQAVTALVVDRLVGILVLALFAAAAISFPNELASRYPALYGWVAFCTAAVLLTAWTVFWPLPWLVAFMRRVIRAMPENLRPAFKNLLDAVTAYHGKTSHFVYALLLSVALQLNVVTFYYLIALAVGFPIPYYKFYLIVPIAVLVMLIPVSINGIGLREGVFVFLLGAYGIGSAQAVAFAWLEYGLILCYGVVGGIVYALRKGQNRLPHVCGTDNAGNTP